MVKRKIYLYNTLIIEKSLQLFINGKCLVAICYNAMESPKRQRQKTGTEK